MHRTLSAILLSILAPFAMSQTLNIREINRTADVFEDSEVDSVSFYSGEYVTFVARMIRGNSTVTIPSDAVPVWKAWVDGTPETLYINATGTVVNGVAVVKLTPAQSNITAGDYKFQIGVTDAAGARFGIASQGDLEILFASPGGATYVGTSSVFREVLAGSNVTITTNGNNRTIAASDTLGALSPTAGRLIYGNGTAWTVLAPGTAGQVLAMGASLPAWASAGAGDITGVTAGTGLSGGGASGDVTLNLANTAVSAGSYGPATITVDAQGRLTAAATSSSAAIQSALGAVYLPLAGGTMAGNLIVDSEESTITVSSTAGQANMSILGTQASFPSRVGILTFDRSGAADSVATISGMSQTSTRGALIFRTANNAGTPTTALTLDYDQSATFAGSVTAASIDATVLSGDIPAAASGEQRLDLISTSFTFGPREQVGWDSYTNGTGSNAIAVPSIKSANTSEQDFVIRSAPIVVPREFVAFKTTGAIDIDWIADSTTVADIRGIRLVKYVGTTPTVLYSDAVTTYNVSTIDTPANISINRSAFSVTTIAEGDHLVLEITGTIEDSKALAILHACIHSE